MKNLYHPFHSFLTTTLLLFLLVFFSVAKAQNPIPSYNVLVMGSALFVESTQQLPAGKTKRTINTSTQCSGSEENSQDYTIVYVATVDRQTILGPYTLYCGQTLSVEIDDRQWGVLVTTPTEMLISVWIEENNTASLAPHEQPYNNQEIIGTRVLNNQTAITDKRQYVPSDSLNLSTTNSNHYENYFLNVVYFMNRLFCRRIGDLAINIKPKHVDPNDTRHTAYSGLYDTPNNTSATALPPTLSIISSAVPMTTT